MPWVNGRGTTTELARRETAAGRLVFRLSVADVVEDGPFSSLPGVDRQLMLIEGPGFDLSVEGQTRPVLPFSPIAFSGAVPAAAANVRGPSRDFNAMTGAGLATIELSVHQSGIRHEAADITFAYVAAGTFDCGDLALAQGDLLVVEAEAGRIIDIAGSGALVFADVRFAPDGADTGSPNAVEEHPPV